MEPFSSSQEKPNQTDRPTWRCVFLAGLFASVFILAYSSSPLPSALAAQHISSANAFSVSPVQGPTGAVVTVTGSGVFFADGTQVSLGYTKDKHTCIAVADSQATAVQNGAFSGWLRWPATGVGSFGVCGSANSFVFQIGDYQALSANAPRVVVTPAKPKAGQKATVSGTNFLPGNTNVSLLWRSANGGESISLGAVTSLSDGTFTHAFTIPVHSSTGSYTVTGMVGTSAPPVMSAQTTFHVNGITIAPAPTSAAARATSTPAPVPTGSSTATAQAGNQSTQSVGIPRNLAGSQGNFFLPLALGGGCMIVLALIAGVLVVRRQRDLAALSRNVAHSGPLLWPDAAHMPQSSLSSMSGPGAHTPWPDLPYPGRLEAASGVEPGMASAPLPGATMPYPALSRVTAPIPFDPGLVEAMREAQVSLFATPRPPVNEEIRAQ